MYSELFDFYPIVLAKDPEYVTIRAPAETGSILLPTLPDQSPSVMARTRPGGVGEVLWSRLRGGKVFRLIADSTKTNPHILGDSNVIVSQEVLLACPESDAPSPLHVRRKALFRCRPLEHGSSLAQRTGLPPPCLTGWWLESRFSTA